MTEDRYEIGLGGSGGQGIILAALILAEAAGVYDGKHVCQTQAYGPEVRGGASKAEVVISSKPIDYPRAIKLDLLLAMNQASCDAFFVELKPEGLLIVDSTLVHQIPTNRSVAIPFTQIAQKEAGTGLAANMVALGAVGFLSQVVSLKGLEEAMAAKLTGEMEKINRKALRAGVRAAQKIDLKGLPRFVVPEEAEV